MPFVDSPDALTKQNHSRFMSEEDHIMTDKSKEDPARSAKYRHVQNHQSTKQPQPSLATDVESLFTYKALVDCVRPDCPRSIRLLELLPGLPDATIETHLIESTLTYHRSHEAWHEPRESDLWPGLRGFAALSYEWGAPDALKLKILVNGQVFYIRDNLWNFLSQIRRIRHNELPLLLWVDSICINQQDVQEKNGQVRIMHKIYAQAKEVLVWLGDSVDSSSELFRHLMQYDTITREDDELWRSKSSISARTGSVHAIMRNTAKHSNEQLKSTRRIFANHSELMLAVLKLCRRTYWTRAWIIQECLSAKAVALFCGKESLPHDAFPLLGTLCKQLRDSSFIQHLVDISMASSIRDGVLAVNKRADPSNRVVELTNRWNIGRHNGLETLLISYHGSACSVLHDKVYAFLALSSDGDEFPIDYSVSLPTLLAHTIAFCNSSKHRFNTSKIDPIRTTCDSVQIAQLVGDDLEVSGSLVADNELQQVLCTIPEQLLNEYVTIELDYLGPIHSPIRHSKDDENVIHQIIFSVNTRHYESLPPLMLSYGDRVFALRGTSLVFVYRRTITRLHFVGYAMLLPKLFISEVSRLLASTHRSRADTSSGNRFEDGQSISSRIASLSFPAIEPIPRYHLDHSQAIGMRFLRRLILPYLPGGLQRFLKTRPPDSAFFASPFMHVRLELVLKIISIWPKRTRGYEDYYRDLRASDSSERWRLLKRVWRNTADIGVRARNSITMK